MANQRHGFTLVELPVVSKRKSSAFTLVELLVVVAIIAIIMSLLLPALRNARLSAASGRCLSNLHQIALAANMYTMEHKGVLPPFGVESTALPPTVPSLPFMPDHWRRMYVMSTWDKHGSYPAHPRGGDGFLGPYLKTGIGIDPTEAPHTDGTYGGMKFILGCPSEPIGPTPTGFFTGIGLPVLRWRALSYGVNYGDATPYWPLYPGIFRIDQGFPFPGYNIDELSGRLVLMADAPGGSPYLHGPNRYVGVDVDREDIPFNSPEPRHVKVFNAAFVDGHAKGGSIEELWTRDHWLHNYP